MLNALVQTTNDNFRLLANQMSGIRNLMAILQVQPQNGIPSHNAMTLGGIANKKKTKFMGYINHMSEEMVEGQNY